MNNPVCTDWSQIDSVFLDMDGTLLDLHFDNHFWQVFVPQRYAEKHGISQDEAIRQLGPRYKAVEGTMDWYSVDYWTRELDLDIALLKAEIDHLIAIHPFVPEFLEELRSCGKRIVLVTNAHQKSLQLKMERTQLAGHFDAIICSHDYNRPKEDTAFWDLMQVTEPFNPARTLLIDDSLSVLRSAQHYGIKHLLAVYTPDTKGPTREITEYPAIHHFKELLPVVYSAE